MRVSCRGVLAGKLLRVTATAFAGVSWSRPAKGCTLVLLQVAAGGGASRSPTFWRDRREIAGLTLAGYGMNQGFSPNMEQNPTAEESWWVAALRQNRQTPGCALEVRL